MSALISGFSPRTTTKIASGAAGIALAALVFVDTQRLVWRNASETCQLYQTHKPLPRDQDDEMFFGPRTRAMLVRSWNAAVDNTIGAAATELAKRGW